MRLIRTESHGGQPLGELLVDRALITREQLEQALATQLETKRPLGEVIVRLGFASGRMIAQALATQHGGILKSEYGFAAGFDATLSSTEEEIDAPPVTAEGAEGLRLVATESGIASVMETPGTDDRIRHLTNQLLTAIGNLTRSEAARAAALSAAAEHESARRALEEATAAQARQIEELQRAVAAASDATTSTAQPAELQAYAARLEEDLERARGESAQAAAIHHQQLAETRRELEARIAELAAAPHSGSGGGGLSGALTAQLAELQEYAARLEGDLERARRESAQAATLHHEQLAETRRGLEARIAQLEAARPTTMPSEPEDNGLANALCFWAEVQSPEHDPAQTAEPQPKARPDTGTPSAEE